jgi:hypothetical protein
MLCMMLVCQLYRVVFIIVVRFILLLFDFHLSFVRLLFDFCFHSILLLFHCSLFKEKRFNSDPGFHSRYFDPVQSVYVKYLFIILYASQINIIHQTAPTLS